MALWGARPTAAALLELDFEQWQARAELPLIAWNVALGAAASRCSQGGAIVAVVESPAALDSVGWAPEAGIGDAVVALVRSLARSEGERGVRVNAVSTPARLTTGSVVAPPPSLASFPGSIGAEVAGAVRLLLADDARGLSGRVLAADCGRAW